MPITAIFTAVVLFAMYGLAWHDQTAEPVVIERRRTSPEPARRDRRSKASKSY